MFFSITINFPDPTFTLLAVKDTYHERISSIFRSVADKWVFSYEKGLVAKRLHIQGFIHVLRKQMNYLDIVDLFSEFSTLDKHLITVSPCHDPIALKMYCVKDDLTHVEGPFSDYHEKLAVMDLPEKLSSWQQDLVDFLRLIPDNRTILWILDLIGGRGKGTVRKVLLATRPDEVDYYQPMPVKNLTTQICNAGPKKVYIFDCPKSTTEQELRLMSKLWEMLKDGMLKPELYAGQGLTMKSPHVVVFANSLPPPGIFVDGRLNIVDISGEPRPNVNFEKVFFQLRPK